MSAVLMTLVTLSSVQAGCDDMGDYVSKAEQAVLEERLDEAGAALRDAEVAFACGPVVDPDLLVRFWLAQGARETAKGDVRAAAVSFRAAATLAPEHWPVDYGIKPYIQYKAAAELWLGEGSIQLHPEPGERITALDGTVTSFPAAALEGLHLVQVGSSVEAMEFAALVRVQADEPAMVLTGLGAPGEARAAAARAPSPSPSLKVRSQGRRRARIGAALLGGTAAALAGGAAVLSVGQDDVMRAQTSQEDLDAAFARQKQLATATWGLAGISALGITLCFTL